MKSVRIVSLAAIAAVLATAFVGVSSASAVWELEEVVFCKVKEEPCAAANEFPAGTLRREFLVGAMVLKIGALGKILCASGSNGGELTSGENLAHGLYTELTYSSCVRDKILGGTEACTATAEHIPYLFLVLLASDHETYHTILTEHGTSGTPQTHFVCGSAINCSFGSAELLEEVLLDEVNHDTVLDLNQALTRSGGICPAESVMEAKWLLECKEPGGIYTKSCWPKMEEDSVL